jgi:hypothetical protein
LAAGSAPETSWATAMRIESHPSRSRPVICSGLSVSLDL